jgi:putative tryptophan/tyrosine transport system substrate-binding protein
LAAKQATSLIPIVFAAAADPVGGGFVARLDRGPHHCDAGYPAAVLEMAEVQATARTLGLEVTTLEIRRAEDIAPAFEALQGPRGGTLCL